MIYTTTDNNVVSAYESLVKVATEAKLPLIASDTDSVKRGAIAALGINYRDLGEQTGRMVVRILKGEKPGDISPEISTKMELFVNPGAAEKQGVTLSDALIKSASRSSSKLTAARHGPGRPGRGCCRMAWSAPGLFDSADFKVIYVVLRFLGALEIGLIFSLVALGVFISFRLLRFPDLTVDGSFPLGGAVCAILIVHRLEPVCRPPLAATAAGAVAGLLTGWLNVRLKIMDLLASILMMIALYSINLRIMGGPNVPLINEPTLFTLLQPEWHVGRSRAAADPVRAGFAHQAGAGLVLFLDRTRAGACAPPAPTRAWRAPRASTPARDAGRAWRCPTAWWRWPARCSRRPRAAPTFPWASAPSSSAWPR